MNAVDMIQLESPDAFVASLPYVVGYQPTDKAVCVWLEGGNVVVAQAADLDTTLQQLENFFDPIGSTNKADSCIIVFYDGDAYDNAAFALRWKERCESRYLTMVDAIHVFGDHWRSLLCTNYDCCPREGHQIDQQYAAEFVARGINPLSSREAIADEFAPRGTNTVTHHTPLVSDKSMPSEMLRDNAIATAIDCFYRANDITNEELVTLGLNLHDIRVRDVLMWEIANLDEESRTTALYLAARVARATNPEDAAPILTFCAYIAYSVGDGGRANVALELAKKSNPAYSLAMLLDMMISVAMPPQTMLQAFSEVTRNECRYGK